ncbi:MULTISPECIES: TetR/AcrR family transcriptional regulator C-terminal domain-containing protein [unclassified Sedimentibacter]|uniref:TetR/AcrR family transcriptional regulator C-terminal domain-containing protein n=1 Tax=unclassified Sedimentibacter TaxID=2649220 RepID=UPI001BD49ADF|nr:TetR/AcrR family transcriptional regulator C-terminal domain-containing protein [Sedimentibacter sp. MB35-C1]WMJ75835.1 TetR/AcrR family transcriptional regulator C-terminal domain-containing protein [Sedimentibacter sp. MB35-C1]
MSDSQITKKALAESMKKLMEERPMKKINISDIVEGCDMNRQSFYYHFKDKYDLVNWIYYTEFIVTIKDVPMSSWQILEKTCDFFYENKKFYKNAFKVTGQNSFSEYFIEVLHPILVVHLNDVLKNNKDVDFYATFYADAIRVAISRWLLEEAKIPPEQFVALLRNAIEGVAMSILEKN